MKRTRVTFLALCTLAVAACSGSEGTGGGGDGGSGGGGDTSCEADSTFAQIQEQIFEARGCTLDACHGDAMLGGLDLRADAAYDNLVNVPGIAADLVRVFPAEQDLSLLYIKVEAKVTGESLGERGIAGGPMPVGDDVLSDDDLALLRAWIRGGAPENDIVDGSQQFATCDLEGTVAPNTVEPLPVPDVDKGVQFYSGGWQVDALAEGEVCFVSYYDLSAQIPEEFVVPCSDDAGGPDRDCFAYKNILHLQTPQSHHAINEFYVPPEGKEAQYDPMNGAWKNWSCNGGDNDGAACTPGSDECGDRSQCVTAPTTSVACVGYRNGPNDLGTLAGLFGTASVRQNISTAQEATFRENLPTDVYGLVPVTGFIVWDSHAFNLTEQDVRIEQWMNLEFASSDEQVFEKRQIFDAGDIFSMGEIPAFETKEICTSFVMPRYGELLTLSSHTHRHGKDFRVWYPPNDYCEPEDAGCVPLDRDPDYRSRDYSDPLYQRFSEPDLPVFTSPDVQDRTFRYCSLWDNGASNPEEVKRESTKPDAETCDFIDTVQGLAVNGGFQVFGCGCEPADRSCFRGPNQGMACRGDDGMCGDGGLCDACPTGGGVTTEEEMFILLGSYFVRQP
ncbi:MAG: hypothetical protein AAGF92_23330 [Myxococcota bacterium]